MKKFLLFLSALAAVCAVSCNKESGEEDAVSSDLKIVLSRSVIQANGLDEAEFSVMYDGIDVSDEAGIFNEDGTPAELDGMKFTTTVPGSYSFYATFNSERSATVTVTATESELPPIPDDPQPESTDFAKKALMVQFTGVGCTFCPMSEAALDKLMTTPARNSMVIVACHSREKNDPAYFDAPLKNVLDCSETPTVVFDLDKEISRIGADATVDALVSQYTLLLNKALEARPAKASVAGSSTLSGDNVIVSMSVKAAETAEYKVTAWLLEDGIFAEQANGTGLSGDFDIHDNCLRYAEYTGSGSSADFTGHSLGTINAGEEAEYTFSIKVESGWNAQNCHLVFFVSAKEGSRFYANNAAVCEIGGTVAYQYN